MYEGPASFKTLTMNKPVYRKEKFGPEFYCILATDEMLTLKHTPMVSQQVFTTDSQSVANAMDDTLTEECSAVQFWSHKGLTDIKLEKIQKLLENEIC